MVIYPANHTPAQVVPAHSHRTEDVICAVHSWSEGLKLGRWKSLSEIAHIHKVSVARVSQLMPLAALPMQTLREQLAHMRRPSLRRLLSWARANGSNA